MSDYDEENLPPTPKERKPPVIVSRCGECMFFKDAATYKKPCNELGVKSTGRICSKFMPNVYKVLDMDLVKQVMGLKPEQLRMICGLAHQELNTRKNKGASWGKVVYFKLFGDDYLSNYRKGLILAANNDHYYIMSDINDNKIKATLLKDSVLTEEQWKRKEKILRKRKKLSDPNYKVYFKGVKPRIGVNYVPPTIDDTVQPVDSDEAVVSIRGRKKSK